MLRKRGRNEFRQPDTRISSDTRVTLVIIKNEICLQCSHQKLQLSQLSALSGFPLFPLSAIHHDGSSTFG